MENLMAINFSDLGGGGGASFRQITKVITSTQSWTSPADVTQIEVTLVSGGGGGGGVEGNGTANQSGGGGGGGAVVILEPLTVTAETAYTVTVGAGGAGGYFQTDLGAAGSTSSFGSLLSRPGGGPAGASGVNPGVGVFATLGGIGSGGSSIWSGGGGGGAAGTVENNFGSSNWTYYSNDNTALWGSRGQAPGSSDYFRARANPGVAGYGDGGAGGSYSQGYQYSAGRHSGGSGASQDSPSTAGAVNKGGGGGGGFKWYNGGALWKPGSNGGSGVVIIKYWSAL
jgi:hypothetical protein